MTPSKHDAPATLAGRGLIIIPCFNEALSLPTLLRDLQEAQLGLDFIFINDGSTDNTVEVARELGVSIIDLPCNLGVGHAVQTGFQYAVNEGYDFLVRIDGDGQHPPLEIKKMIRAASEPEVDLVVGSRFGDGDQGLVSTRLRYLGIQVLAGFLSCICRSRVTDPTSGFWLVKKNLFQYFAREFPTDYPEPEGLAILRRQGYVFSEAQVCFRARKAGVSSIKSWGTVYYALKVGLALVVDRMRPVNRCFAKGERT